METAEWKQEALAAVQKRLTEADIKAEITGKVIRFLLEEIGDRTEWRAMGEISFVPYVVTGEKEEVLQVYLTVAKNIDRAVYEKLAPKLLELNDGALFGRLGISMADELYYICRIPSVGNNIQTLVQMIEFVTYEMFTFLDAYFPYMLVIINEPEKLTLARYVELMQIEEDAEADEEDGENE